MSKRDLYEILRYPINTEKSTMLAERNVYIFKILKDATKCQVKKAVEVIFNVKVREVRTLIIKGKTKVFRGRKGRRADDKRAFVTLESGQKLDFNLGA